MNATLLSQSVTFNLCVGRLTRVVQPRCELSHQRTRSLHEVASLPLLHPNFPKHRKALHEIQLSVRHLARRIGGKDFRRAFVHVGNLTHCSFEFVPAELPRFLVAVRMLCSKRRRILLRGVRAGKSFKVALVCRVHRPACSAGGRKTESDSIVLDNKASCCVHHTAVESPGRGQHCVGGRPRCRLGAKLSWCFSTRANVFRVGSTGLVRSMGAANSDLRGLSEHSWNRRLTRKILQALWRCLGPK